MVIQRSSTLALFTFGLAFVVILLGAFTRLTDAGLSCPDWPHCYGFITAPHTVAQIQDAAQKYPMAPINVKKAWTEMTHRYAAGVEGILILTLAFSFFFGKRATSTTSKVIAVALIALLGVQVTLGMLTVTEKLKPVIVLSHLLTGISILSVLWWAYLNSKTRSAIPTTLLLKASLWLGLLIVIMQITLGGWVSTHYAGLACIDFPYCNGQVLPAMQWDNLSGDLVTIHMLHRIGAMITATYLGLLTLFLFRHTFFRTLALTILLLITLQITLGIFNIIWLRPVWIALMHQGVAILLLLTLIKGLVNTSATGGHSS